MASITVRQAQAQDAAVIQEMLEEAARWVDALGVVMWDEGELDPDRVAREAAEVFKSEKFDRPSASIAQISPSMRAEPFVSFDIAGTR